MEDNQTSTGTEIATTSVETKEKPKLTISQLRQDLKDGLTRKQQAEKYGVPLAAINRAYKSTDKLKGKRVFSPRGSRAVDIELIDDVADEVENEDASSPTEASTENESVNEQPAPETVAQTEQPQASTPSW